MGLLALLKNIRIGWK